jgi:hypothetical protein
MAKRGKGHPALRRSLVAGAVGAGLVLVWWGVFRLFPNLVFEFDKPEGCNQIGCALSAALASVILTIAVVVAVSVVVSAIVLRWVGVRPSWPVALLGPVLTFAVAWLRGSGFDFIFGQSTAVLVLAAALSYGLAGLIVRSRA